MGQTRFGQGSNEIELFIGLILGSWAKVWLATLSLCQRTIESSNADQT